MPCCAVLLILFLGPRIVMIPIALFSGYLTRPFGGGLFVPLLGWIFLPWTTLAYAWAINSRGELAGLHLAAVILAVLIDLGVVGGGAARRARRER